MKRYNLRNMIHSINLRKLTKPAALCISVLFIVSTLSVFSLSAVQASTTAIFSDSFDSKNFSAWAISNNNGGTESVQTSTVYGGSNVAKFTKPSTANSWAVITKNLGTTYSTLFLAGYVCLDALPSSGNYLMAGITLDSIYGYDLASACIHNNAGTLRWSLEYLGSGGKSNYVDSSLGLSISVGTWYYIEVMCKVGSGTGEATMWVNNTQISDVTGLTNNYDGALRIIQIGPHSPSAVALNDYIDNIVVSTSFITMPTPTPTSVPTISPTPTPKPTATSTPTPTPTAMTNPNSPNLVTIPNGWTYSVTGQRGIGSQSGVSLDTNVLYNGNPTLKIDCSQSPVAQFSYGNQLDPEANGAYRTLHAGDHIVFHAYIKITSSTIGDTSPYHGAQIDIDLYGAKGRICGINAPDGSEWTPQNGWPSNNAANTVPFGTSGWKYVSIDFIVPQYAYADGYGGPYSQGTLVAVNAMIPVLFIQTGIWAFTEGGSAWFAGTTLYINP